MLQCKSLLNLKILLISYYFPPFNSVGAVRPGKLAKYLHRRGHLVHVLTAKNPAFLSGIQLEIPASQVHEVHGWSANSPVQLLLGGKKKVMRDGYMWAGARRPWLKRLGSWYKTLAHWPDAEIGWVATAISKGKQLLAKNNYDVIYVSSPPFSALRVGRSLSLASGIPWVAEYRDLWTDNHSYAYPVWRHSIEKRWERRLLRETAALVTISSPLAERLLSFGKPVWEVRNGFDPEEMSTIQIKPNVLDTLNIVYTGSLYPDHHDLSTFCSGLAVFKAEGGKVRVHVAGRNVEPLLEAAQSWKVDDLMDIKGTVNRNESLGMQCSADILLLFLWKDGAPGIYTTKLFEYAGARRPILAIGGGKCDVSHLIRDANIGVVSSSSHSVAAALHEWQNLKMELKSLSTTPRQGHDFTRDTQFAQLESRLDALIASAHPKY